MDDFRFLTRTLETTQTQYITNQLAEDRDLVVISRGVTESISDDAIKA